MLLALAFLLELEQHVLCVELADAPAVVYAVARRVVRQDDLVRLLRLRQRLPVVGARAVLRGLALAPVSRR